MQALPASAQLYVYYRVASDPAERAIAAVQALQAELTDQRPGLRCSVLQRSDSGDAASAGSLTLMEVYGFKGGIGATLAAEIERSAQARLGTWLLGERHVEVFVPCA